jgi:hypothetical protein
VVAAESPVLDEGVKATLRVVFPAVIELSVGAAGAVGMT